MTPIVEITGAHAKLINDRLISWEHIDVSGRETDQLTLVVDTNETNGLPTEGQKIGLNVGYKEDSALTNKGEFVISRIKPRLFPASITIIATAAPFQVADKTEYKLRRDRSFEDIALGTLFRQVVQSHGFRPRIAPDLANIQIAHIDQDDETDGAFLNRIAKQHDALVKPIDDLYVLARRGQIKSISGQNLPELSFSIPFNNTPTSQSFIDAEVDMPSRSNFNGVKAKWWSDGGAKETPVQVGQTPFKRLRGQYTSEQEALNACNAELRKLSRSGMALRMNVPGNPQLGAEGLINLDATFPGHMQGRWSLDRVVSRGNRGQGYRCSLVATVPV